MPTPLLPARDPLPVWRRAGIRTLEARLQASSQTPLMDLAGLAVARLALALAPHARRMHVLAGPGNNGGDGLEAARLLHQWGQRVAVNLLADPLHLPTDARRALARASQAGVPIDMGLPAPSADLGPQDLCIDALLGIGATRPAQGDILEAIGWLQASPARVLAVDVPTGLDADSGQPLGPAHAVVRADHTLTLLAAKPGLFMGHGRDACGRLWLDRLGLDGLGGSEPHHLDPPPDAQLYPGAEPPPRAHASHKGSHGDVAVVGGESVDAHNGMRGAAVLAATAALSGGAGRVMVSLLGQTPSMLTELPADLMRRSVSSLDLPSLTVVAGCGGGRAMADVLSPLIRGSVRLVLDADALNRVAEDPWLQGLLRQRAARGQGTVLTPHPLEAARLLGCTTAQVQADRLTAAQRLADQYASCVVLKGSGTVISMPGHPPRINTTGNGRLATGGTGDVLAGLIGARLSGGDGPWTAACGAVWAHGQTADTWPSDQALTASRLASRLR